MNEKEKKGEIMMNERKGETLITTLNEGKTKQKKFTNHHFSLISLLPVRGRGV